MYNFDENKNVLALFHFQKLLTVYNCAWLCMCFNGKTTTVLYIHSPNQTVHRQVYRCCGYCCFYILHCFKQLYIKLFCILNVKV